MRVLLLIFVATASLNLVASEGSFQCIQELEELKLKYFHTKSTPWLRLDNSGNWGKYDPTSKSLVLPHENNDRASAMIYTSDNTSQIIYLPTKNLNKLEKRKVRTIIDDKTTCIEYFATEKSTNIGESLFRYVEGKEEAYAVKILPSSKCEGSVFSSAMTLETKDTRDLIQKAVQTMVTSELAKWSDNLDSNTKNITYTLQNCRPVLSKKCKVSEIDYYSEFGEIVKRCADNSHNPQLKLKTIEQLRDNHNKALALGLRESNSTPKKTGGKRSTHN